MLLFLPDPVFTLGYYLSPVETRVGPRVTDFSLMQKVPWFGTLNARADVAKKEALVRLAEVEAIKNEIFLNLALLYYDFYLYQNELDYLQEQVRILKTYEELSTVRVEAGGRLADVLLTQISIERMNTMVSNLEEQIQPVQSSFNSLLNRSPGHDIVISDSLTFQELESSLQVLVDSVLISNPTLEIVRLRKEAADEAVELARLQGSPELGAGVSYGIVKPREDMVLQDNGRNVLMPMVSVSIPIYRKKYNSLVKERKLMAESFELQTRNIENELTAELYESYSSYAQSLKNRNLYQSLLSKTNTVIELLVTEFSTAGEDFEEVLFAQNQWLEYRIGLLESIVQNNKAIARIHKLLADYQQSK